VPSPRQIDDAGRAIAGLLTYNPGPGIYSRLERAVQQMPENVRVQELPGLLKRYKDGVPGWELKETDLDSVIAGRDVVPRSELLARVKERSPVYTHKEVVLGDGGAVIKGNPYDVMAVPWDSPAYQDSASSLGLGNRHGDPRYDDYGQGGSDYTELLITQPGAGKNEYGNHWTRAATDSEVGAGDAVAHARFDTHGDALRINELQSDLGIHNRRAREAMADFVEGQPIATQRPSPELPFPLEDSWSDLLIKRLALEAARKGHRAIEVASPRAIADKVGGNIDNYEHFYGKVVPGALERLGRKMGGLVDESPLRGGVPNYDDAADAIFRRYEQPTDEALKLLIDVRKDFRGGVPAFDKSPGDMFDVLAHSQRNASSAVGSGEGAIDLDAHVNQWQVERDANALYSAIVKDMMARGAPNVIAKARAAEIMPRLMRLSEDQAHTARTYSQVRKMGEDAEKSLGAPPEGLGRRYLISDEMRRRLIQEGVGAAIGAGVLSQDDLIERLGQ
jgi:hypothetical protein